MKKENKDLQEAIQELQDEGCLSETTEESELLSMLIQSKMIQELFKYGQKAKITAKEYDSWKKTSEQLQEMYDNLGKRFGNELSDEEGQFDESDLEELENLRGGKKSPSKKDSSEKEGSEDSTENTQDPEKKRGGDEKSTGFILSESEIDSILSSLETKMINNMDLVEMLNNDELVDRVQPSISVIEHLLFQKGRLSGKVLVNAKKLVKRYVDSLAEVFKLKVDKSIRKIPNPDIVPKKTFSNLDIKRTIWKNLSNWQPEQKKLYIDNLRFIRAGKKTIPSKIIVIVDQSGSMVSAMVQTTILASIFASLPNVASIFASLPNVKVELLAFDTKVLNLSDYVNDPFEALMNCMLGGGTYINQALIEGVKLIEDPENTAVVLITDYYECGSYDVLFNTINEIIENKTKFISVGSIDTKGYAYINSGFVNQLKRIDIETIIGGPEDLIEELRKYL